MGLVFTIVGLICCLISAIMGIIKINKGDASFGVYFWTGLMLVFVLLDIGIILFHAIG